ncbi:ATPase AAA [Desulfosarcina alkanivorans]|uniref:ATPase AAA n=1 Tax=Desulfosarcina alkanivorans TaxID=571177 RepID=A0A5K7YU46_9BACT|nr:sigma-54 dependent transcriptional regulator [Desulfosarcina alkanivorans]BBO69804.1 ATPase AAA [Desulfosarcina alkanivorans]
MEFFFREATLAICGSLDIEEALWQCLLCIRKYIPADMLSLHIYEQETGLLETVAYTTESGGVECSFKNTLPVNVIKDLEERRSIGAWMVDRLGDHDGTREAAAYFNGTEMAGIIMDLVLGKKLMGVIVVAGKDPKRFLPNHLNLLELLNKPIAVALTNSMRHRELKRLKDLLADDSRYFQNELRRRVGQDVIGTELGLYSTMEMVRKVAPINSPVLLLGETGVGKELIAGAIHNSSSRKTGPMISFNCGAIPPTLMDSELFGYEKGAFTGATSQKRGVFERAQHGTIFLDEIGELAPDAQIRLLRVLQQKEIQRVGGVEIVKLDIRVIAATHRDLKDMMGEKKFRKDLFFRLNVFPITIPPLRERKEDIPALVQHFILEKAREMKLRKIPQLMPDDATRLMDYEWPGNIRELENAVERALILNKGQFLTFEDFPFNQMKEPSYTGELPTPSLTLPLDTVISKYIQDTLAITKGKIYGKGGAAELLSVNPSTLRHRMKKLGITSKKTYYQSH